MSEQIDLAAVAKRIQQKTNNFQPKVAIILGSGLGAVTEAMQVEYVLDYQNIPGFDACTVAGHAGKLCFGLLSGVKAVCLQGRLHLYEGADTASLALMLRSLKQIGCETLLVTNAAGSLNTAVEPGHLLLINDHINFQGINPLVGRNDEAIGPRFPAMNNAYDSALQAIIRETAGNIGIELAEGVYIAVLGPGFETPAEIRAFRLMGADAVGMSTVPEVILAVHCGMRVAAISVITNLAAGLATNAPSHEETLATANKAAQQLSQLIINTVEQF